MNDNKALDENSPLLPKSRKKARASFLKIKKSIESSTYQQADEKNNDHQLSYNQRVELMRSVGAHVQRVENKKEQEQEEEKYKKADQKHNFSRLLYHYLEPLEYTSFIQHRMHHESKDRQQWSIVLFLCIVFNAFMVAYCIGFNHSFNMSKVTHNISSFLLFLCNIGTDICFYLHIALSFFTSYTENGNKISDSSKKFYH